MWFRENTDVSEMCAFSGNQVLSPWHTEINTIFGYLRVDEETPSRSGK